MYVCMCVFACVLNMCYLAYPVIVYVKQTENKAKRKILK